MRIKMPIFLAGLAVVGLAGTTGPAAMASPADLTDLPTLTSVLSSCPGSPTISFPADPTGQLDPVLPDGRVSKVAQDANAAGATWLRTTTCTVMDQTSAPTSTTTENWAGSIVQSGTPYDVDSRWKVPDVHGDGSSTAASLSIWNGLGGFNNQYLSQAGTESDQKTGDSQTNFAWYENLPHDPTEVRINGFGVSIGDTVEVETTYSASVGATFFLYNFRSNQAVTLKIAAHAPGKSAEFVYERPTFSNGYHPLAKFDDPQTMFQTNWDNTDGNGTNAYGGSGTLKANMVSSSGKTLMSDSIATSGDITFTWKAFK